jgi:hypothetical protein
VRRFLETPRQRNRPWPLETRTASLSGDIAWLQVSHAWPGLEAIGKVTATREIDGKTSTQTRYYLLNQAFDPTRFNAILRMRIPVNLNSGSIDRSPMR